MLNSLKKSIFICVFCILSFVLTSVSFGDVIYLKNGRKVSGDIISETETLVSVKTVLGRMVIKQKDIVKIQREEAEISHVRNGDYLIARGEYNLAVSEYESALRLDPANPDVATKLSDAKRKAAEALSSSMSPDFAKGDEFLSKGFYDSAIREYRSVVKQHNDETNYIAEAEVKTANLANVMLSKAQDLAGQQDFNRSFELYQQATTLLPPELTQQASTKFEETLKSIFNDSDQSFQSGQFARAILGYNKFQYSNPGEYVRQAVKSRIDQIGVNLTYKFDTESNFNYITRAQFSADPTLVANLGTSPGVFQTMDFFMDNAYHITSIQDNGNSDIDWTVNKAVFTIAQADGKKPNVIPIATAASQNVAPGYGFAYFAKRSISGQLTPQGYFTKPIDLARMLHSKGLTGERLDQNSFTGIIPFLSRFPVVKPSFIKVGDTWSESINDKSNIGPLTLTSIGQIDYTLSSFEVISGKDCAKLSMNIKMTHSLRGTIGGLDGLQQNVDISLETPLTGAAYIDDHLNKVVRYALNGEVKMKGQLLGIRAVIPQFGDFGGARGGGKGGPLAAEGGNLPGVEGPGAGIGGIIPQIQSQQQVIPEVSVKIAMERNLVEPSNLAGQNELIPGAVISNSTSSGESGMVSTP